MSPTAESIDDILKFLSDCHEWGLFQFDRADETVAAGYKAAQEQLAIAQDRLVVSH